MAKAHSKQHPGITPTDRPAQGAAAADDLAPLCNRIAALTFAASFGVIAYLAGNAVFSN